MKEQAEVLLLSSSPTNADPLQVDREARAIQRAVEDGCPAGSAALRVATRWAAEPLDLLREVRALRPTVLHFVGYGARGQGRDGVYFRGPGGGAQLVSAAALRQAIASAGASIRVVVFNACYVEQQVGGLSEVVDCVIGVGSVVDEAGARAFAREFYRGLAEGVSVRDAWTRGCVPVEGGDSTTVGRSRLWTRDGVDAAQVYVRGR